jgi:hypothetical protein
VLPRDNGGGVRVSLAAGQPRSALRSVFNDRQASSSHPLLVVHLHVHAMDCTWSSSMGRIGHIVYPVKSRDVCQSEIEALITSSDSLAHFASESIKVDE